MMEPAAAQDWFLRKHEDGQLFGAGMSINVEDRIRDLEQALREERRALQDAEERYRALEAKYQELAQGAEF